MDREDGMLFIGPEAERRFGRRHFMGLMAVFTAPPEFTVLHGRNEIGRVDPVLLIDWVEGPEAAAARWPQLASYLDRLEAPPLLRRARRVWRPGSLADQRPRRHLLRTGPRHARRAAWRGPARHPHPTRGRDPGGPAVGCHRARATGTGRSSAAAMMTCAGGPGPATGPTRRSRRLSVTSPMSPSAWTTSASGCVQTCGRRHGPTAVKELREHLCLPEIDDKALAG